MLKGMVAIVTGGASGLGRATVEQFLKEGAKVTVCDLPNSAGEKLTNQLGQAALFSPCDVSMEDDVRKSLDLCKEKFGRLDILVNSAATTYTGLVYDKRRNKPHPLDEFIRLQTVNLIGTFNFISKASPYFAENVSANDDGGKGVIINVASIAAFESLRGVSAYAASKGALVGMTLPLARDLAAIGVRVITVAPGIFDTPMYHLMSEQARKALESQVLFPKRLGNPEEFAHLVQEIVLNKMVNGTSIRLDAGLRSNF